MASKGGTSLKMVHGDLLIQKQSYFLMILRWRSYSSTSPLYLADSPTSLDALQLSLGIL